MPETMDDGLQMDRSLEMYQKIFGNGSSSMRVGDVAALPNPGGRWLAGPVDKDFCALMKA